jgi:hypothetical protein
MTKHRSVISNLVLARADTPSGHRSGRCSRDILDLYSGGFWFESRIGFRLSRHIFPIFLPGECREHLRVVHVLNLLNPYLLNGRASSHLVR